MTQQDTTLSALQHYAYCRRQWGLIFLEQQWAENAHTAEGQVFHRTAHHGPEAELRGDTLILRGLRLESARLHLHGVSDVVEFHRSPDGVALHGREGLWLPYPVEYKKGSDKTQDADEVQLCAQALCLEEMLCCAIPEGSLFYGEPRRRTRVALDEPLRVRTLSLLAELLENQARGHTPSVRAQGLQCLLAQGCMRSAAQPNWQRPRLHARPYCGGFAMRKMLNTLFVTTEDAYLSLENENIVVHVGEEKRAQYPLLMLEGILTFSYKGASPALMGACAERGIGLTFLTPRGRFLARVCGSEHGNVLLRREQYRRADSLSASCLIARNFIFGKVYNQRWVLERTIRDHALRVNVQALKDVSAALAAKLPQIESAVDLDGLRGLEGDASADYFSVFDEMILSQKADFLLNGRNRRPPQDNLNALLSFAYVLLANDCAAALESVGLDAYVGFMHRDRPGRTSLALDLMEELRAPMADRLCITLVNNRVLQDKHFDRQESGAVFLNDAGRKQFLTAWQNRKREEITHPFLKEKIMWGLVPYVQALLLARTLRGDTDGYPPFLWK